MSTTVPSCGNAADSAPLSPEFDLLKCLAERGLAIDFRIDDRVAESRARIMAATHAVATMAVVLAGNSRV